jgi:hypothetical protein
MGNKTGSRWPKERDDRLAAMWRDPDKTVADVSVELGVTWAAIKRKAERLRLGPKIVKDGNRLYWSADEDAVLRRGLKRGSSWADIARVLPPRSMDSCRKRACYLGIVREEPIEPPLPPLPPRIVPKVIRLPVCQAQPAHPVRVLIVPPAHDCQFPLWSDGTPRFERRVCESPVWRGSYCRCHWEKCYETVGERILEMA